MKRGFMDVIVLAGGLGTRLRSVVSEVPKCMAPVAERPFLYYILDYLRSYNVERVILSVGYLREKIYEWIDECRSTFPFEILYAVEETPLGTGGGIRLALNECKAEQVAILNGDTFFNVPLDEFATQHVESGALLSVALKPMENFSRYGNVELNEDGTIAAFKEKSFCERGFINGGVYMASRAALCEKLAAKPAKFSFETEVLQELAGSDLMYGFKYFGYFIDIGIPEDYSRADREFKIASGIVDFGNGDGELDPLFLDRDGVINRLRVDDYVKCIEEFEFMPGVQNALARWSRLFKRVIVVTNQRGVGKGVMTEASLVNIHQYMVEQVEQAGGRINAIYYCTALKNEDPNRKPHPGMAAMALGDFPQIDLEKSVMIGDSESDKEFAKRAKIGKFICV